MFRLRRLLPAGKTREIAASTALIVYIENEIVYLLVKDTEQRQDFVLTLPCALLDDVRDAFSKVRFAPHITEIIGKLGR